MSDIEEEQPTQQTGRQDWDEEGEESASLEGGDELGGRNLVETQSVTGKRLDEDAPLSVDENDDEADRTSGDLNPGGDLSRAGNK